MSPAPRSLQRLQTQQLVIGAVLHMRFCAEDGIIAVPNGKEAHEKFFVIIGMDGDHVMGVSFINSEINRKIIYTEELWIQQYPIKPCNYSFLKYTSNVDCSQIRGVPKKLLLERAEFKCNLLQEDLDLILQTIAESVSIPPKHKKRFGLI
jgi:hypothetical protein